MHKTPPLLALSISLVFACTSPSASALPADYNVLDNTTLDSMALSAESAALIDGSHPLHIDSSTQLPTFLWAASDSANRPRHSRSKIVTDTLIEQAARKHLARYATLYQLGKTAQASAKLQHVHHIGDSAYIVRLDQQVNGIEVFASRMNLLLDRSLQLSAISGHLAPQVTTAKSSSSSFRWTATQAIAAAFHDLHQQDLPTKQLKLHKQQGAYQWYALQAPLPATVEHDLSKPVRIKKVLYPLAKGLEPSYYIELSTKGTATDRDRANYAYVISAANGALLLRSNMTHNDRAFTYRVWADDATLMPYDSPYGDDALTPFQAALAQPVSPIVSNLVTLSCGPISTCDPWLPDTATKTRGNNVEAYVDLTKPDGFSKGDIHANRTAPYTFDYGYDFSVPDDFDHTGQLQAAIVQAFYTTNFMHDWLYDHGFDELAGNGQNNNYRRGGIDGDRMLVEVNDYSGTDNANMTTPLDGASATMQLFLWTHEGEKKLVVDVNGKKYSYTTTSADFGPSNFSLSDKKIVLIDDGVTITTSGDAAGSVYDACQTPIVNAADLAGAIALIDRGDCKFVAKAKNAQDVGAIAVLIANNKPDAMTYMAGTGDPAIDDTISIPVLGINQDTGTALKQALAQTTVTAMMVRKPEPPYNSALDNTIVIHEWGHFLSQRLVWLNNNQGNSLGEGWSDFLALLAIVKEQDRSIVGNEQFQAPYAVSQYVSSPQPASYLSGIRRYPYSTDLSKNPLTFKYISNGVALPADVPTAVGTDMTGSANSELHNSGEVWASMLWEAYTALLNDTARLSFSEAQNRMLDYLVASLKMTPANPTFLEARDALLVVAKARDPADYALFWQAFAKRGAGIDAKAPKHYSRNHAGVVEDFTTP
ncbi:MAG: hypothetical protein EPN17_15480 [Methylobacter sp.]|nr:MAG: hypothetical protein EPN17_15480 [Methylobacter sp.]